ncbi:MAG: DNA internalization-related competence protein ComEC/Rec2 [Lachnospiraceae bacterium]
MRILIWFMLCFVLGEVTSWQGNHGWIFVLLFVVLQTSLWIWQRKNGKKNGNQKKWWLVCLPFLFFVGMLRMHQVSGTGEAELLLAEKRKAAVQGSVSKIEYQSYDTVYYLKHVTFQTDEYAGSLRGLTKITGVKQVYDVPLRIGQKVEVYGTISLPERPTNDGQFNSIIYDHARNVYYHCRADSVRHIDIRYHPYLDGLSRLHLTMFSQYQRFLKRQQCGILSTMLLGNKSMLEREDKDLYQKSGISHVLAISGLHIGFIGQWMYRRLRRFQIPIWGMIPLWLASFISILFVVSYGFMTGMGMSAFRALLMLAMNICADLFQRTYDMSSASGCVCMLMLIENPIRMMDAGFLLSFGAIFAIAYLYPCLQEIFKPCFSNELIHKICGGGIMTLSIQIVTLPVILWFYYEINIYSVLLNMLVIPMMSLLLPCAMLLPVIGFLHPMLGHGMGTILEWMLNIVRWMAAASLKLPYSVITIGKPPWYWIACYYMLVILLIFMIKYHKYMFVGLLAFCLCLLPGMVCMPKNRICFLDVGQGDCAFIQTKEGVQMLIDGGSSDVKNVGKYRMIPFLKSQGVRKLDAVWLSHPDEDHCNGIIELLEEKFYIDRLYLAKAQQTDDMLQEIVQIAAANQTEIVWIQSGDSFYVKQDRWKITCLYPEFQGSDQSFAVSEQEERNELSQVLLFEMDDVTVLFSGDMGEKTERKIFAYDTWQSGQLPDFGILVLKVAHHGSNDSSCKEFLDRIQPDLGIISCGRMNRYGHPGEETVARLEGVGTELYYTMRDGQITLEIQKTPCITTYH